MTNKIVAAQAGDDNWGYAPDHSVAPDQWPKYYATGAYQSPINILVDHCERLKGSTCCHSRPLDEQCPATRLRDSLQVTPAAAKRRSHLDSAGEDQRHVNGSSGSSSKSSSPSQHFYGQDDYDEDEHENSSGSARDCKETNSNNNNNNNDNQINRCYQKQAVLQQNTRFCVSHKKIFLGYPRYLSTMQLCNTGHGWQVNLPGELATHTRKYPSLLQYLMTAFAQPQLRCCLDSGEANGTQLARLTRLFFPLEYTRSLDGSDSFNGKTTNTASPLIAQLISPLGLQFNA